MTQVALGSCWRRGGASPVWSAHEALPDGRMLMVRWVARNGELQLARMHAPLTEFTAGQWRQVALEEMTRETTVQEDIARSQRNPPPAGEPVNAALEAEAERLRQALADGPAGGARGTIDQLREVHELIARDGPPTLQMVSRAVTHAAPILGRLLELTERAAEHLSELHGPAFAAWRCDECGTLVSDEQLGALARAGVDGIPLQLYLFVHPIYKDGDADGKPDYVECLREEGHGPMRHVLCRVTADSPDSLPDSQVATPTGGGGS